MAVGVVVCCVVVVCEVLQKIDEALNCLSCPAEGCPTVKWDRNFLVGLGVVHPCRSLERDRKSPNPNSAQGGRYEGRGGVRARVNLGLAGGWGREEGGGMTRDRELPKRPKTQDFHLTRKFHIGVLDAPSTPERPTCPDPSFFPSTRSLCFFSSLPPRPKFHFPSGACYDCMRLRLR